MLKERQIAIFADLHALLEPAEAILKDIKKRNITEIYSLGDNIGVGPNPSEVLNLLEEYNVKSVSGNSEYYISLGIEPFSSYFNSIKKASVLWTQSKLNEHQKGVITLYPASIKLIIGEKKLALCHFANDVRFDFGINSCFSYYNAYSFKTKAYEQFNYTNSKQQLEFIKEMLKKYGMNNPITKGYLKAMQEPLFTYDDVVMHQVDYFDAIFQGHVHFKIYEKGENTNFYSIRSAGTSYGNDPYDMASYVILKENKQNGYDFEEVLIKYDRNKMINSILSSDNPDTNTIKKFTSM